MPSDLRAELDALKKPTSPLARIDRIAALIDLAERLLMEYERLADNHAVVRGWREREDRTERLGKLLDEAVSAITWMSGASDFNPDGQAGEAFRRDVLPLVDRIEQERDAK